VIALLLLGILIPSALLAAAVRNLRNTAPGEFTMTVVRIASRAHRIE
jgi:hypothetical protein